MLLNQAILVFFALAFSFLSIEAVKIILNTVLSDMRVFWRVYHECYINVDGQNERNDKKVPYEHIDSGGKRRREYKKQNKRPLQIYVVTVFLSNTL